MINAYLKRPDIFDNSVTIGSAGIHILDQVKKDNIMIYRKINSLKMKSGRNTVCIILVFSLIVTFSSCMTTQTYYENPDTFKYETPSKITKIELNDGKVIDCDNKIIKFETDTNSVKYIVINSYVKGKESKTYWFEKRIPVSDILRIHSEKSELNIRATILLCVSLAAIVALLVAFSIGMHSMNLNMGH